jgi:hypothetical protein
MQARGLRIDEGLRQQRIEQISARIDSSAARLDALALPLIESKLSELAPDVRRLFEHSRQCECCGGGSKARAACWRCAGFEKAPGKRALAASGKALAPCSECAGAGKVSWLAFNGGSVPQKQALLYEVLKLPRRYKSIRVKGKPSRQVLSTDEETLSSLLAGLAEHK